MDFLIPLASLVAFSGLLFYFRWSDAKNTDIRGLQNYIRSVEKEIELYFRKKEKEFDDKIIPAEVTIDRMHKLAQTLQEKVEEFDTALEEGDQIYRELRQEMGSVSTSLKDYRRMRSEFEDIEAKISEAVAMRDMVAQGSDELARLRGEMKSLRDEYNQMMTELSSRSEQELQNFFEAMQKDLSEYLSKAKKELSETDGEIRQKIDELHSSASGMGERLENFKAGAETGILGLQEHFHQEITVLRSMAESNVAEIIDRWNTLKEESEKDRLNIENNIQEQGAFFMEERARVREEINGMETALEEGLLVRVSRLNEYGEEIEGRLKNLETGLKTHLELGLDEKTSAVRRQLEQTQQAFAAREEELSKKLEEVAQKAETRIGAAEHSFYDSIDKLQGRVHDVADRADKILLTAEGKINDKMQIFEGLMQDKVGENMQRLEDRFQNENEDRMRVSIEEITKTLEDKYVKEYETTFQNISASASLLEERVEDKLGLVQTLGQNLQDIKKAFAEEKETIVFMAQGLSETLEKHDGEIHKYLHDTVEILQRDMQNSIAAFFEDNINGQKQDQEEWSRRYAETLAEARQQFTSIKDGIDSISRDLKEIEHKTLSALRSDSERLLEDTERRLEDLKRDAETVTRENKDNYNSQLEIARKSIGDLKQELWNQENKVREQAQRDFDRLSDRVKEYDKRFNEFIKKTEALERLENAAEKFQGRMQELEGLKKDLERLSLDLLGTQNRGQDIVADLKLQNSALETNSSELIRHTEQAHEMQQFLQNSMDEAQKLGDFLHTLETEKQKAQHIQGLLLQNLERYNELREALDELESRKVLVTDMLSNIDTVNRMMGSTSEISDKISDLGNYAVTLQRQLVDMQEELSTAVNDKNNLRTALEKVTDLDNLIHHVEQERISVEKMVEWVAKASNMLKNSGAHTLGSNENSAEQIKQIMGLYKKDWSAKEIANKLKLSPDWVEMVIEKHK